MRLTHLVENGQAIAPRVQAWTKSKMLFISLQQEVCSFELRNYNICHYRVMYRHEATKHSLVVFVLRTSFYCFCSWNHQQQHLMYHFGTAFVFVSQQCFLSSRNGWKRIIVVRISFNHLGVWWYKGRLPAAATYSKISVYHSIGCVAKPPQSATRFGQGNQDDINKDRLQSPGGESMHWLSRV